MDFNFGKVISASLLLVVVRPQSETHSCTRFADLADPCGCTLTKENFDPICGNDGNTYMNACFLDCQQTIDGRNIRMQHKGICSRESQCTCNSAYAPVCGNNGVTYSNECVLNCNMKKDRSIRLKHRGTCAGDDSRETRLRSEIRKCYCNPSSGPICATDGVTYFSACVMRCKNKYKNPSVAFKYWGECETEDESYDDSGPFKEVKIKPWLSDNPKQCKCGVDSIVYFARCGDNGKYDARPKCFCQPKVEKMQQNWNPCSESYKEYRPGTGHNDNKMTLSGSKSCLCAAVNKPVCGNNQETYANNCVLHCYAKKDPSIKFAKWGTCGNVRLVSRLKEGEKEGKDKESETAEDDDTLLRKQKNRFRSIQY